jgi:tetratricopeptide (TPR) repeat protein
MLFVIFALLALVSPSYALGPSPDSKTQGVAHYIMAIVHDLNGEEPQANAEYQQSIRFNGLEPAPRLKLAAHYLSLNDFKKAAAELRTVEQLLPQAIQVHYWLALIYSSEHQYDLAAPEYAALLKAATHDEEAFTDAHMYLGQLYYAQGKYPQAIAEFLKFLHRQPDDASALIYLGSVYEDSHDRSKAIAAFRKALAIDPDNSEALNSLGYLYAEQGVQLDEAVGMIQKAINRDPSNGAYWDSLGWALYKQGHYQESFEALQKALSYIQDKVLDEHMKDVRKALKK